MSARSTVLEELKYKNGRLAAMKLGKEAAGADNPVTLKNGFELSLENKQLYSQDIKSAEGKNVLIGNGEHGSKLFGNLAVESGSQLECKGKLHFTTLRLDGEMIIKEGATVTVTDKPSGTAEQPLQIEVDGIIANRGNEPVEVYDLAKQRKITVIPGWYYTARQGEDYELSKINWEEPAWEDENGGEFEEGGEEQKNSSSLGGCNAGFGALALLGVLGMFYRKKK